MKRTYDMKTPALVLLLGVVLWTGCKRGEKQEEARPNLNRNPLEITASPEMMEQLELGAPSIMAVAGSLKVSARIEADETRMARVSTPVTGRIIDLEVVEGQTVHRGQVIARIRSKELSDAQSDFLQAESQRRLAERAVDRAKRLLEADVIGVAELQRREAELFQVTAELSSLRDQLRVLGMAEEDLRKLENTRTISATSQVVATLDGTVLERNVTIGQVVQAAEILCVLADLSRVWLVADVPEQEAGNLEVGETVEADIPALPGVAVNGRLSFVSATVNRDTRTVRTRMNIPNPNGRFKPAMLANMELKGRAEERTVVPTAAIVREGNQPNVFVALGGGRFVLRPVRIGPEFKEMVVLEAGLRPGEQIVLNGAFHLNNERNRRALQGG